MCNTDLSFSLSVRCCRSVRLWHYVKAIHIVKLLLVGSRDIIAVFELKLHYKIQGVRKLYFFHYQCCHVSWTKHYKIALWLLSITNRKSWVSTIWSSCVTGSDLEWSTKAGWEGPFFVVDRPVFSYYVTDIDQIWNVNPCSGGSINTPHAPVLTVFWVLCMPIPLDVEWPISSWQRSESRPNREMASFRVERGGPQRVSIFFTHIMHLLTPLEALHN